MHVQEKTLEQYSRYTGIAFRSFDSNAENAVAVVLAYEKADERADERADEKFNNLLNKCLELNVPTLIIAGNINANYKNIAQEAGFSDEAIIVKDQDVIRSLAGREYARDEGVTLLDMVKMCQYVYENDIRPVIYVWKDDEPVIWQEPTCEEKREQENKRPQEEKPVKEPFQEPIRQEPRSVSSHESKPEEKLIENYFQENVKQKQVKPKPKISSSPIEDLVKNYSYVISVFKTVSYSETSNIAKSIANAVQGVHLEITSTGISAKHYGSDRQQAILSGRYAYSPDGERVDIVTPSPSSVLVLEVDTDHLHPSLLANIYEASQWIVHVPGKFNDSESALDAWIDSGYKLDGILATSDIKHFKSKYPNLVQSLEQAIGNLRS